MRSGLFAVRAEHEREKEAEEYDRGDAGGSGFQPSRDRAEHVMGTVTPAAAKSFI